MIRKALAAVPGGPRRAARVYIPLFTLFIFFYLFPLSLLHQDDPKPDPPPKSYHERVFEEHAHQHTVDLPAKKVVQAEKPEAPVIRPKLGQHKYLPNGLLEVNPEGPHPIYELIAKAEKRWEEKKARASQNLEAAVAEYHRRYKRAPPKGFDAWWDYVVKHNVQLPDEYDQIHYDLEPFWGVEPAELIKAQEEVEKVKDSYTLGKAETGKVSVVAWAFQEGKYDTFIHASDRVLDLLQDVADFLPPFRATFSPHDGPNRLSDYDIKNMALQAARSGTYVESVSFPKIAGVGWRFACPPNSPARQRPVNLKQQPTIPKKKTFIHDHIRSMDPCEHTSHFLIHGQYLGQNMGPAPQAKLVPQFGHCRTMLHHNIRMPSPYGWVEEVRRSSDPPFMEKDDDRLLWRGRNTGIMHGPKTLWQNMHRNYLMRHANDVKGTMEVLETNVTRTEPVGAPKTVRKSRVNPGVMDVAYALSPIMCRPEAICKQLEKIFPFRPYQNEEEAGNYKYVLDIDGNGWSGRFKRLMTTNSLVFKTTIYPEWFHDRVEPWVHYVPIQLDLSDLHDALMFFRGNANGDGAHEELARRIALAGREWSKTYWRREDLVAYFFRLILEYARLLSLDREAMSFRLPEEED